MGSTTASAAFATAFFDDTFLGAAGATDAVGIDRLELSNAADDGFKTKRIDPPQRWTLSDGDGRKRVFARWWNAAGLSSAVVKDGILLDTTDPEATAPPSYRTYLPGVHG